jgi:hypothetical protein
MALTDGFVLTPGVGHIFTKAYTTGGATWTLTEVGTYASAGTVPAGWEELGHTDLDSVLTFAQDGGDTTTKGSWQNPSLKQIVAPIVDSFQVNAEQVLDNDVLTLFNGGGDISADGRFAAPDSPAAIERSVVLAMLDGTTPLALSVRRCAIIRADSPTVAADDFLKLPLKFTILKASGQLWFEWINENLGTPA